MLTTARSCTIALGTGAILSFFGPCGAVPAQADVVVSSAATQDISCSNGVCAPTAADAVLNVSDLETMLASGNVEVTTTGSGEVQANNIDVDAALSWSAANMLSFDAFNAITVNREISVAGLGGLTLSMPNDTLLAFEKKGHVVFRNLSSPLTIGGTSYMLVGDIKSLASAISANPSGTFALANSYDASADGIYAASPIQTTFTGIFEGLGNAITHLSIKPPVAAFVGLFKIMAGTVDNIRILDAKLTVTGGSIAGILSSEGYSGFLNRVVATGKIEGKSNQGNNIGGLSGGGSTITNCYTDVRITNISGTGGEDGGLVFGNGGTIEQSFATGSIKVVGGGGKSYIGGLVGDNTGGIENSYATVSVTGGMRSRVGGLVGRNGEKVLGPGVIGNSYSIGAVSGANKARVGGFGGTIPLRSYHKYDYWDTDTSGTDEGTGRGNEPGITGMSTADFKSGLPQGFDPTIWAQDRRINNGFPYLIANPPPK